MSIEQALSLFTNQLISGLPIDLTYYQKELSTSDYKEFEALTSTIELVNVLGLRDRGRKLFKQLNASDAKYPAMKNVANLRADSSLENSEEDEAHAIVDKLFSEEFSDE